MVARLGTRYLARVTNRSELEQVVHQVNNLLATIEIQAEVAKAVGTPEAMADALRMIVEAARRTQQSMPARGAGEGA